MTAREARQIVNDELLFRGWLAGVSLALALIRIYYGRWALHAGGKVLFRRAGRVRLILVWTLGLLAALASALWVVAPVWLAWASLSLPMGLRWLGVGTGVVTVLLFWWVHRTLGQNWAMPGEIKEKQTLVTGGPFGWVRHPMYATLFVWALAYFLLSANGLIGLAWLGLALVAAAMVDDEEAALLEKFGDAYRAYQQHTGRFLPRFWNNFTSLGLPGADPPPEIYRLGVHAPRPPRKPNRAPG